MLKDDKLAVARGLAVILISNRDGAGHHRAQRQKVSSARMSSEFTL